jgi:N-acetylmuramoyl-L-alanine amidase
MGVAARMNAANGFPRILATRLSTLRAAVDVQHLYRTGLHRGDRGSRYTLANGTHINEADAALIYAAALTAWLKARSAAVLTNNPITGELTGPYSRRIKAATMWGTDCYLACHLNAGGGSYAALEYLVGSTASGQLADRVRTQLIPFSEIRSTHAVPLAPGQRGEVCLRGFPRSGAALILEPFFGDNPDQQDLFAATKLHQLGETIGEGIAQWWERRAVVRVA